MTYAPDTIAAMLLIAFSGGFLIGWSGGKRATETRYLGKLVEAERNRYRAMFGEEG